MNPDKIGEILTYHGDQNTAEMYFFIATCALARIVDVMIGLRATAPPPWLTNYEETAIDAWVIPYPP